MNVKQCAEKFGVSSTLIRELLKMGLLRGLKTRHGWEIDASAVEVLGQTLASLREHASPPDLELPAGCWDWLYEAELPQAAAQTRQPVSASSPVEPPPSEPRERQHSQEPEPVHWQPPPARRPVFTRAKPLTYPLHQMPDGPPCPVCHQLTCLRILDADASGWYNYCETCEDWVLDSKPLAPQYSGTVHAADYELQSRGNHYLG